MIHCIYHTDNDGICAAAIVNRYYSETDINFIGANYDKELPWSEFKRGDDIIIVDFSLQKRGEWDKLINITPNITWIDHHKSAINKKTSPHQLPGLRIDSSDPINKGKRLAGAMLTWKYFFKDEKVPTIVDYISDYDTWEFNLPDTSNVCQGLYLLNIYPEDTHWNILFKDDEIAVKIINSLKEHGWVMKKYDERNHKSLVKNQSSYAMFHGYKAIIVNARGNSKIFDSAPDDHDIKVWWWYSRGIYNVRISSDNPEIDCSKICEIYGGGGHQGIGGFEVNTLPIQLYGSDKLTMDMLELRKKGIK